MTNIRYKNIVGDTIYLYEYTNCLNFTDRNVHFVYEPFKIGNTS